MSWIYFLINFFFVYAADSLSGSIVCVCVIEESIILPVEEGIQTLKEGEAS